MIGPLALFATAVVATSVSDIIPLKSLKADDTLVDTSAGGDADADGDDDDSRVWHTEVKDIIPLKDWSESEEEKTGGGMKKKVTKKPETEEPEPVTEKPKPAPKPATEKPKPAPKPATPKPVTPEPSTPDDYWKDEVNFDTTRLDKLVRQILHQWGTTKEDTASELRAVGEIAGEAFEVTKEVEKHLEVVFDQLKGDYGGDLKIEFDNLRDRFIIATDELRSAELMSMDIIRTGVRVTRSSWKTLFQAKDGNDEQFTAIASQEQRIMAANLANFLNKIDDMISKVDFAMDGRANSVGGGFENVRVFMKDLAADIQRQLSKGADELEEILIEFKEKKAEYIKKGNIALLTLPLTGGIPIISMILWSIAHNLDEPDVGQDEIDAIREKVDIIANTQNVLNKEFNTLVDHIRDFQKNARKVRETTVERRSALLGLGGTLGPRFESRENIAMWRFAIPNKICLNLRVLHKNFNQLTRMFDTVEALPRAEGSCELNEGEAFPATPSPVEFDPMKDCLLKCGGELALEEGSMFHQFCMANKCQEFAAPSRAVWDESNPVPTGLDLGRGEWNEDNPVPTGLDLGRRGEWIVEEAEEAVEETGALGWLALSGLAVASICACAAIRYQVCSKRSVEDQFEPLNSMA